MDLEARNKVSIKMLWRVSAENFEIQHIKIAQIGSEAKKIERKWIHVLAASYIE